MIKRELLKFSEISVTKVTELTEFKYLYQTLLIKVVFRYFYGSIGKKVTNVTFENLKMKNVTKSDKNWTLTNQ